jgi:molecular chaperone HscB
MTLGDDDFALFDLPQQFAQDSAAISARWKALQRLAHPDKFAAEGDSAQRLAMQWSVRINEAYQRLKNPLSRASYLCQLHGAPVNAHSNTAMPVDFLQQQMHWREALEEASSPENLNELALQCSSDKDLLLQKIERLLDNSHDYATAAEQVRQLFFIERLGQQIDDKLHTLTPECGSN